MLAASYKLTNILMSHATMFLKNSLRENLTGYRPEA